uniref:Complex III subunit 9 n=1 Tax=Schistosoma mansoni TaxID=6183 RepID=A0A5K4F922_SCHMA
MLKYVYYKILRYPSRFVGAAAASAFAFEFLFFNGLDKIYFHVNKGLLFKDVMASIKQKEEEE